MWSCFNENPSREKIIYLLKKNGPMSIDDLSKELHITSMGIRQHLLSLERRGLIDYVTKRQGIGRPAFLYKLTEKADDLFPKAYCDFGIQMLRDIEKNEGRDKVENIFKWRKIRMIKDFKDSLSDKKTLRDRVSGIKDILESDGYFAEFKEINSHYSLEIYNCPLFRLATEFDEACRYDLQMFRELLGKEVTRKACIIDGDPSCTYIIPGHS